MSSLRLFRLGERALEDLVGETEIYSLVKSKAVMLFADITKTSALITAHNDQSTAFATATISGTVILRNMDALQLLENGKVSTDTVYVTSSNMTSVSSDYPFQNPLPLSSLKHWVPEEISSEPTKLYRAMLNPEEQKSFTNTISDLFSAFPISGEEQHRALQEVQKNLSSSDKYVLATSPITIKKIHVLLSEHAIREQVAIQKPITQDDEVRLRELDVPPYPIVLDLLLYLRKNPDVYPAPIWLELRKEHAADSANRIDVNESIKAISASDMTHYDANSREQSMTRKRFTNIIGKLRKIATENR